MPSNRLKGHKMITHAALEGIYNKVKNQSEKIDANFKLVIDMDESEDTELSKEHQIKYLN